MKPLRAVPKLLSLLGFPRLEIASARRLDEFVLEQLETNVRWHERAGSGAWICPYCLAAVPGSVRAEADREAIEDHLAVRCGPFGAGWEEDPGRRFRLPFSTEPCWQG